MNCHPYHDLLMQRLDGSEDAGARLAEHLRGCSDCRALVAAARRLDTGLRLLAPPAPPPDLAARIVAHIAEERRHRRRVRRRWAVGLALAAGLLLALGLRLSLRIEDRGSRIEDRTAERSGQPSAETHTLRQSATEASKAVAVLTRDTTTETVEKTRSLLPRMSAPALPDAELPPMGSAAGPLREAGEGVSTGMEPVTSSARRAVDLFLRELPPMDTAGKGF